MNELTATDLASTAGGGPAHQRLDHRILAGILYLAARWARRRSAVHAKVDLPRTTDERSYRSWRQSELDHQLTANFDVGRVAGKDVLDFGCGTGELCRILRAYRPSSVTGVDVSADAIERAMRPCGVCTDGVPPVRFVWSPTHDRIPMDDASVDLVCCFDVVEHIPDVGAIAREWRRILRAEGRVWIWWSPWRAPYGHHLESLIPLPWVHLLFPRRVIFDACARLYDDPDYIPRNWDRNPDTGAKRANKWRHTRSFEPFLNRLDRRKFERFVRHAGLALTRRETHGFRGSRVRRATRVLTPLPLLGDCFVSHHVYELSPASVDATARPR